MRYPYFSETPILVLVSDLYVTTPGSDFLVNTRININPESDPELSKLLSPYLQNRREALRLN